MYEVFRNKKLLCVDTLRRSQRKEKGPRRVFAIQYIQVVNFTQMLHIRVAEELHQMFKL